MDSLPASSRGLALRSADHMQDLLRWTLGRFGRLQDVCGDVSNFITQVAEAEGNTKIRLSEMGEKLVDLSNGLIGLGSSVRHTQDEQLKAQRQAAKSLSDIGWQLSGAGKGVNTSVKESLLSLGKLLSQIDANVGRQGKAQEETNALLKTLNGLMKSLVDVEQRKTTLVAQAAKAASTVPANTGPSIAAPASVPASAPAAAAAAPMTVPATLGTGVQTPVTPAVAPKLLPTSLGAAPGGFPSMPTFPPAFSTAGYSVPTSPCSSGCASGSVGPPQPSYKRMRTSDGHWVWVEQDPNDI